MHRHLLAAYAFLLRNMRIFYDFLLYLQYG